MSHGVPDDSLPYLEILPLGVSAKLVSIRRGLSEAVKVSQSEAAKRSPFDHFKGHGSITARSPRCVKLACFRKLGHFLLSDDINKLPLPIAVERVAGGTVCNLNGEQSGRCSLESRSYQASNDWDPILRRDSINQANIKVFLRNSTLKLKIQLVSAERNSLYA